MFAGEFTDLCTMDVVWAQKVGRDSFAKPTYAAPVTFVGLGRRVYKTVRRMSGGGSTPAGAAVDFIQVSYIWLLATPPIKQDDLVYIAGDAAPYPPIVGIDQPADETGEKVYTKITLGSANG